MNATIEEKLNVYEKEVEQQVYLFAYLGSTVTKDDGTDENVRSWIRKVNIPFIQLHPIWRNQNLSKRTIPRIFSTNVKSVLLYACETLKVIQQIADSGPVLTAVYGAILI